VDIDNVRTLWISTSIDNLIVDKNIAIADINKLIVDMTNAQWQQYQLLLSPNNC